MAKKKTGKLSPVEEELVELRNERENLLNFKFNFKCKTKKQKELINSILDKNKEIIFAGGAAGTGRSFCCLYAMLQLLKDSAKNNYEKIIVIYPTELDKSENLGFLSGNLDQKIAIYTEATRYNLIKLFDASGQNGKELVNKLIATEKIEFKPSTYLRGCTFDNSLVIIEEAQNIVKDTFLKILTRIGTNSKYCFLFDLLQLDANSIKTGRKEMGITYAIEKLKDFPEVATVQFNLKDIIRNDIIIRILHSWDEDHYPLEDNDSNEENSDEKGSNSN